MIDNIRLSEKAKQQLIVIKRKTGIENWNVLCRWALCLSLAEESIPPFEDIQTDSSVEMSWKVFAGDYSQILQSIFIQRCYSDLHEYTRDDTAKLFKIHLHRGISYLFTKASKIDGIIDIT